MLSEALKFVRSLVKDKKRNRQWRRMNAHNDTFAVNTFPFEKVQVGRHSYGPLEVYAWQTEGEGLQIGHFCSIAKGVRFLLGGEHGYRSLLTFPVQVAFFGAACEARTKGPIILEDDVWIGMDALILSGVRIGKGSIIGAGAVVSRDIPPFSIAFGNPAVVHRPRFPRGIQDQLAALDYGRLTPDIIRSFRDLFEEPLDESASMERLEALRERLAKA